MAGGKRPRPQFRRTTSMTGITVDVSNVENQPEQPPLDFQISPTTGYLDHSLTAAMVSPRYHKGRNDNSLETAQFLRTCGLCHRGLAPGRDIYMYRGDTAFCSLECREQQIKLDKRKEKCSMVANSSITSEQEYQQSATSTAN